MKQPSEVIQDMRGANLKQIREELEYLHHLAKSQKSQHLSPYEHVVAFFERAKLRDKSE